MFGSYWFRQFSFLSLNPLRSLERRFRSFFIFLLRFHYMIVLLPFRNIQQYWHKAAPFRHQKSVLPLLCDFLLALTLLQLFSSSFSFFFFSSLPQCLVNENFNGLVDSCRLCHPNIVQLLETYEDKTKVYLIMELWVNVGLFVIVLGSLTRRLLYENRSQSNRRRTFRSHRRERFVHGEGCFGTHQTGVGGRRLHARSRRCT